MRDGHGTKMNQLIGDNFNICLITWNKSRGNQLKHILGQNIASQDIKPKFVED